MPKEKWESVKVRKETLRKLKAFKEKTGASYAFVVDKAVDEYIKRREPKIMEVE